MCACVRACVRAGVSKTREARVMVKGMMINYCRERIDAIDQIDVNDYD